MLALVFPGKVISPPNIREARATAYFLCALLERVPIPDRVSFIGRLLVEQPAQIDEVWE